MLFWSEWISHQCFDVIEMNRNSVFNRIELEKISQNRISVQFIPFNKDYQYLIDFIKISLLFTLFSDNKLVYDIRKTYDITLYSYSIKRCSYNYNNINLGYNKDFINFNEKSSKMYEFYSYAKGPN